MPGPLFAVIGIIVMLLVMRWVFKNGGCGIKRTVDRANALAVPPAPYLKRPLAAVPAGGVTVPIEPPDDQLAVVQCG